MSASALTCMGMPSLQSRPDELASPLVPAEELEIVVAADAAKSAGS